MLRPGDANETAAAWRALLERRDGPVGLALTRQGLPVLEGTDAEGVAKGGYVLVDAEGGEPEVVLIATGSELQLAVEARKTLQADGVATRVVSMPCVEWFDAQDETYRNQVIPPSVRARVAVEAGIAQPWYRFAGDAGEIVSIEHFGASADYKTLFREFGFTTEAVVDAARRSRARAAN
jgi:transketolase